ncbi:MAG: 4-hydroxybenzoate polyprenyltransferase, mitochondrial [Chlamydiales bacterium]|nr:4-hydroxybenzoate polyprenyltransferase, mitochondrial [Chlamydiales bacterium]MCH9620315.1 4-hydroxybenzoate polyprenyltransferase, mitochondrial [Chlamydiales bacterium]MCH9622774.1 4-hydroxybenzoate polyprenyltransferase, mitochondrial [Chlamydiales bacterium]
MQKQKLSLATFVDLTRFEMTLFGLPFILAGALLPLANYDFLISMGREDLFRCLWIIPAFLAARIAGMAFNQLIDHKIDAQNPRTSERAIPSGRATPKQARTIAWSSLALFVLICSQINTLCFLLSPFAAGLIYLYAYLKRFTAACHAVLGTIHLLGPLMASVAVCGKLTPAPFFLGVAASLSIAGNDIVWAIQDYYFDKKHHLHSIPSRFGIKKSLKVAQLMHLCCVLTLFFVGKSAGLHKLYFIAPIVAALFFVDFHQKVSHLAYQPSQIERLSPLFFRCNLSISLFTGVFVLIGVVWAA